MNDDEQKWENLCLYRVYATDKELEEIAPWAAGIVAVVVVVCVIIWLIS